MEESKKEEIIERMRSSRKSEKAQFSSSAIISTFAILFFLASIFWMFFVESYIINYVTHDLEKTFASGDYSVNQSGNQMTITTSTDIREKALQRKKEMEQLAQVAQLGFVLNVATFIFCFFSMLFFPNYSKWWFFTLIGIVALSVITSPFGTLLVIFALMHFIFKGKKYFIKST